MEKHIEVMKISQELVETMLEGLEHIKSSISSGKFEQTIFLFEDVLIAFSAIEQSIEPFKGKLEGHSVEADLESLKKVLELTVASYEEKNYSRVQEIVQFSLGPQFKKLRSGLEEAFKPYLLS